MINIKLEYNLYKNDNKLEMGITCKQNKNGNNIKHSINQKENQEEK